MGLLFSPPLLFHSPPPPVLSSKPTQMALLSSVSPSSCLVLRCHQSTSIALNRQFACGLWVRSYTGNHRGYIVVRAADGDEGPAPEVVEEKSGDEEPSIPVEKLPLESKLQMQLEQKLRMKMAKKIRLKRKRLVRKRHLRKKGRWPPSKMKKNKNV